MRPVDPTRFSPEAVEKRHIAEIAKVRAAADALERHGGPFIAILIRSGDDGKKTPSIASLSTGLAVGGIPVTVTARLCGTLIALATKVLRDAASSLPPDLTPAFQKLCRTESDAIKGKVLCRALHSQIQTEDPPRGH